MTPDNQADDTNKTNDDNKIDYLPEFPYAYTLSYFPRLRMYQHILTSSRPTYYRYIKMINFLLLKYDNAFNKTQVRFNPKL